MVDDHLSICPYCGEPFPEAPSANATPDETPQPTTGPVRNLDFEDTNTNDESPSPQAAQEPEPYIAPEPEPEPEPEYEPEPYDKPEPKPEPEPRTSPWTPPRPTPAPPDKKGNMLKILLILLCALLVIGIGLLVYLLWGKGGDEPEKDDNKPTAAVAVQPVEKQSYSEARVKQLLDSVAKALPDGTWAVAAYPDSAGFVNALMLADGMMKVFHADKGATETINFPPEAGDVIALSAEQDSEDDSFIIIEAGDDAGNSKGFYIIETYTNEISPMDGGEEPTIDEEEYNEEEYVEQENVEEERIPARTETPSARNSKVQSNKKNDKVQSNKKNDKNKPNRYGDNPQPYQQGGTNDHLERPGQSNSGQGTGYHLEPAGQQNNQGGQGTGFHLEPAGQQNNQGGQGTGVRLQKVGRIPNQR